MDFYSPHDYFDSQLESKDLFPILSMDGLMDAVGDDEVGASLMKKALDMIRELPLGDEFEKALAHPDSAELMNNLFPNLKGNPTMQGFFESFDQMNSNLMESDGYDGLRKGVQKGLGINRNQLFDSNDPCKIIDKAYEKLGATPLQYAPESRVSPKWYNDICNEFFILDSHGYQEDKVQVKKGRKQTFRNPTEDSNHAAYASMCSVYIVKDNKSYNKAKKVYERLGIYTRVLKPKEFLDYYNNFLADDQELDHLHVPFALVEQGDYNDQKLNGKMHRVYFTPYLMFDFFNLMLIPHENPEDPSMILMQNIPNNSRTYLMEIHHVHKLICGFLGEDIEKLGQINSDEFNDEGWIGRSWNTGGNRIMRLDCFEGHLQLTYNYKR